MTEDEVIQYIKENHSLSGLPSQYKTKEFVLKCINDNNIYISVSTLLECFIKIDYDIVLATVILMRNPLTLHKRGPVFFNDFYRCITPEEVFKIKTIVGLL